MAAEGESPFGSADRESAQALDRRAQTHPGRLALPGIVSLFLWAAVGVTLAALLYQPWRRVPFDIVDFSEFLPLLIRPRGVVSRLVAFVEYYVSQGRLNVLGYVFIVAKWQLFGWNTAAWQTARFCQMCAIVGLVYVLLRRLGATVAGAVAGAALFIVARSASPGWIRLTMGEPVGLMAILGGAITATRFGRTRHWVRDLVIIVACLTAALLAKEMLVGVVPFVLAIAITSAGASSFGRPRLGRRELWLLGATAFAVATVIAAVALVALHATTGAHASEYGTAPLEWRRLTAMAAWMSFPMRAEYPPRLALWLLPANILFGLLLLFGWRAALATPEGRRRWTRLGAAALLLPLIGALEYLPWPTYNEFYGLPFLLGSAVLLAVAVSALDTQGLATRRSSLAVVGAIMALSAMPAAYASRASMARREVNGELAQFIADHPSVDSVVVPMPFLSAEAWQGVGPTLGRYAAIMAPGKSLPRVIDMLCRETIPLYRSGMGHAMLATYADRCGVFPVSTATFRRPISYVYWPSLSMRRDTVRIDVFAPSLTLPSAR